MKLVNLLFVFALVAYCIPSFSQITAAALEYNGARLRPIDRSISYESVEGSPYHDQRLVMGLIISLKGDSLQKYMRYDSYSEEMEFVDENQLLVLKNPEAIKEIYLNGNTYVYRIFSNKDIHSGGFLIRLSNGKYPLYKRNYVIFEDEKPGKTPYHKTEPNRFTEKGPLYYYSDNGTSLREFDGSKSDLKTLFGDEYDYFEEYIDSNKLKIRKEEDLIKLFDHLNTKSR